MARYGKTYEQKIRDKERRDDIKEILNFIKYHADEMELPAEIRDLVRDRLQTSHRAEKSEQTILLEKWNQYVDDQCHALLTSLIGTGFVLVQDIVTQLPFEMTPQQFGQRVFRDAHSKVTDFVYLGYRYRVARQEMRATKLLEFEGRSLLIPCTKMCYRVTKGA